MLATPSNMTKIERMLNDFKDLNDKVDNEQSAKIAKLEKKVAALEKVVAESIKAEKDAKTPDQPKKSFK